MPVGGRGRGKRRPGLKETVRRDIEDEVSEEAERIAEAVWKRMRGYIRRQQRELQDEGGDDDDPWTEE